jgi:hypothetical protein
VLTLRAILELIRIDSSLLGFLAIFIPLLLRTNDFALSLKRAIPLLFICICTFTANDLDDVERDKVNHPQRALPAGRLAPAFAVLLYFASLGAALFLTKQYVSPGIAFCYYALIAMSISYRYVVEWYPSVKAPYVAIASSVPILIVAAWYPSELRLRFVAGAVFLLIAGREICMDIKDRAGDNVSFMHRLRPTPLAVVAFSLHVIGLLLLVSQIDRRGDIVDLIAMSILLTVSAVCWFRFSSYKLAIIFMKLELFAGLYFLV